MNTGQSLPITHSEPFYLLLIDMFIVYVHDNISKDNNKVSKITVVSVELLV